MIMRDRSVSRLVEDVHHENDPGRVSLAILVEDS